MTRKLTCLAIALVMMLALFAGCNGGGGTSTTAAATTAAAGTEAAATTAPAAVGGDWDTGSVKFDPLGLDLGGKDLTFQCSIGPNDARTPVWEEMGEYVATVYNGGTIKLVLTDPAEYLSKIQTLLASGMGPDVFSTASTEKFTEFASSDALLALDPYLDNILAGAYTKVPEDLFKAVKYQGKIYAMIPFKDLVENNSILYDASQLEAAGVEMPDWTYMRDMDDTFYAMREYVDENFPERHDIPISGSYTTFQRADVLEQISSRQYGICANFPGYESVKGYSENDIFCAWFTPEFTEFLKRHQRLTEDRIYPWDPANYDPDAVNRKSGDQIFWNSQGYLFAPDNLTDYPCTLKMQAISLGYTGYAQGALQAINGDTDNPDQAAMLMEILSCDKYLGTCLRFGKENTHWRMSDDGIRLDTNAGDVKDSGIKYWYGVQIGDITNCVLPTDVEPTFGEALAKMNGEAVFSNNMGFSPNTDEIANECTAISGVFEEYMNSQNLLSGMLGDKLDSTIEEFQKKLKDNKIDLILETMQKQLEDWRANG